MEKGGKPSKQFVACSIFNSFSAWHKDECQTTEETNRRMTERNVKKKEHWGESEEGHGGIFHPKSSERHTHTHTAILDACARIYTLQRLLEWIKYAHDTCDTYGHEGAHRHTHAPWISFSLELRRGRREFGWQKNELSKTKDRKKEPDSITIWALGSSNKLALGHHGDTTNRMRHPEGWPPLLPSLLLSMTAS